MPGCLAGGGMAGGGEEDSSVDRALRAMQGWGGMEALSLSDHSPSAQPQLPAQPSDTMEQVGLGVNREAAQAWLPRGAGLHSLGLHEPLLLSGGVWTRGRNGAPHPSLSSHQVGVCTVGGGQCSGAFPLLPLTGWPAQLASGARQLGRGSEGKSSCHAAPTELCRPTAWEGWAMMGLCSSPSPTPPTTESQ